MGGAKKRPNLLTDVIYKWSRSILHFYWGVGTTLNCHNSDKITVSDLVFTSHLAFRYLELRNGLKWILASDPNSKSFNFVSFSWNFDKTIFSNSIFLSKTNIFSLLGTLSFETDSK